MLQQITVSMLLILTKTLENILPPQIEHYCIAPDIYLTSKSPI